MHLSDSTADFSWIEGRISASSDWFSLTFLEEMPSSFRELALELAEVGHGSRTLQTDLGAVTITLVMAKKAELHVSIRLQQPPEFSHEVRLFFNRRQSELRELFSQTSDGSDAPLLVN